MPRRLVPLASAPATLRQAAALLRLRQTAVWEASEDLLDLARRLGEQAAWLEEQAAAMADAEEAAVWLGPDVRVAEEAP